MIQIALQRCNDTLYRCHKLCQLWQHPFVDQSRNLLSVRPLVGNDFFKQLSETDAADVFDCAGQLAKVVTAHAPIVLGLV